MAPPSDQSSHASAPRPFVLTRVLNAPKTLVFKAWNEQERLHRWFGPRGFSYVRGTCNLYPGGVAHYCLRTPEGEESWGKWVFCDIVEPERLTFINAFSDEKGSMLRHPMNPKWPLQMLTTVHLSEPAAGRTSLELRWTPFDASA